MNLNELQINWYVDSLITMIGERKISLPCHAVHGSRKSEQKRLDNRRRGPAVVGGKMQRAFPERAFLLKCIPPNRLTKWACPSF